MSDFYQRQVEAIDLMADGIRDLLGTLEDIADENDDDELARDFRAVAKNLRVWQSELRGIDTGDDEE